MTSPSDRTAVPASSAPADKGHRYPGDRLMRIGAWITAGGMVLTVLAIVPLVVPSVRLPSAFWWLAMVTGVGLALVLAGLWQAARARSRTVARGLVPQPPPPPPP